MTTWASLLSQPKPDPVQQAQQLSYIKYTAPTTGKIVITSESRGLILSSGTTGFRTWEAALHLGTFLSTPAGRDLMKGKRVVELGAGTGFLSLYCAMDCGVESVVVTDREPALIENISDCVKKNGVEGIVLPGIWEWGTPLEEPGIGPDGGKVEFDVAIGADLVSLFPCWQIQYIDKRRYMIPISSLFSYQRSPISLRTTESRTSSSPLRYGTKTPFRLSLMLVVSDPRSWFLLDLTDEAESNNFTAECLPFESPSSESQTGFFHSTDIPIRTYRICRS